MHSGLSTVRTGFGISCAFSLTSGVLWSGFHTVLRVTLLVDSPDSNSVCAHSVTRSCISEEVFSFGSVGRARSLFPSGCTRLLPVAQVSGIIAHGPLTACLPCEPKLGSPLPTADPIPLSQDITTISSG